MHAEPSAPRAPADGKGRESRQARRPRALRGRCRHLHRRPFLHPPLRLPVAHRRAEPGPAAARAHHQGDRFLCRLRALRRGRARGRALPVVLPGLDHQQPEHLRPPHGADARGGDRRIAAPPRAPPDRRGVTTLVPGPRPITVAILAMGGEGGGVLSDWIVDLAEHSGYLVQATSVPGVAQRTGATVYYLELFPKAAAKAAGRDPVLALMPMPGDVDVVIASELMEAGRAVQRGFVTPDRTTVVASTHRVYAMTEKIALADGRVDATRSPINAVLFGALAGADALPFGRPAFEAAIRRGRVGVEASLEAFKAGFEAAQGGAPAAAIHAVTTANLPPPTLDGRDMEAPAAAVREPMPSLPAPLAARLQEFPDG